MELIALHFAVRNKAAPVKTGAVVHILDAWWLVDLKEHADRKDAIKRWQKFNKQHPYDTSDDEWERLYLPMDEDDAEDSSSLPQKLLSCGILLTSRVALLRSAVAL